MKSKVLVLPLLVCAVFIYALHSISERRKDAFPDNIELSSLITDEGDWVQGCGIIIFAISNTAVSKINQGKLVFFEQSRVSKNSQNHYRWQETPVEEEKNVDGSFVNKHLPGFSCAKSEVADEYKSIVNENMKVRGS